MTRVRSEPIHVCCVLRLSSRRDRPLVWVTHSGLSWKRDACLVAGRAALSVSGPIVYVNAAAYALVRLCSLAIAR